MEETRGQTARLTEEVVDAWRILLETARDLRESQQKEKEKAPAQKKESQK